MGGKFRSTGPTATAPGAAVNTRGYGGHDDAPGG